MKENNLNEKEEYLFDKEKKNNNKYIMFGALAAIILIILLFILSTGTINKKSLENKMKKSSKEYFEKYMSVNENSYEYIVTLEMLENANKQGEKYDLKGLEKCKKQTTCLYIGGAYGFRQRLLLGKHTGNC